ncbi:histone-fold-containing protein [Glonium stellatum]|uniref:Histone-fold-containing protein n=1 Tax=Glonium stellatum TaxID=574774 RepID=A0A8E2JL71_9PEZI|nr:histone-fold-containing protein [Glonium stellatum]
MPYNNTPIAPPQEYVGSVSLPLARVKKIINADEDVGACSNNAAFVIALATEMFIQYFAEQTHTVVKTERKPRRNIQYRDVANAVARIDNLEFLSDVVPKTMPYKKYKEQKAAKAAATSSTSALPNGQTTLAGPSNTNLTNGNGEHPSEHNGHAKPEADDGGERYDEMEVDSSEAGRARDPDDPATIQLEIEMRGPRTNGTAGQGHIQSYASAANGAKAHDNPASSGIS